MTNTYYHGIPIDNVETLPMNNTKEKANFLINDSKAYLETDSDSYFDESKKNYKRNWDFGKKLFNNLRINNIYFTKTQKWLGHVVEVGNDGFTAILKDLTNGGTEEFGEFFNEEITPEDIKLITKGAAFYMSLGYISNNGTRKKESEIRFQRLAEFDEEDVVNNGLDLTSKFINYF
jgi:hypothetical protein